MAALCSIYVQQFLCAPAGTAVFRCTLSFQIPWQKALGRWNRSVDICTYGHGPIVLFLTLYFFYPRFATATFQRPEISSISGHFLPDFDFTKHLTIPLDTGIINLLARDHIVLFPRMQLSLLPASFLFGRRAHIFIFCFTRIKQRKLYRAAMNASAVHVGFLPFS